MVGSAVERGPVVNTTGSSTGEDNEGATTASRWRLRIPIRVCRRRMAGITLTWSGIVDGRDPAGKRWFAISINNAGEATVAQYLSLEHPTPGASYDEAVNLGSLVNAVVTVTDGDGDVATQNIAIGNAIQFQDDGPTAILPDHAVVTNSGAGAVLPFELDQDGTLADNYGADNEGGTVRFPSSLENSPSGLTSGGAAIIYHVSNRRVDPDG